MAERHLMKGCGVFGSLYLRHRFVCFFLLFFVKFVLPPWDISFPSSMSKVIINPQMRVILPEFRVSCLAGILPNFAAGNRNQ